VRSVASAGRTTGPTVGVVVAIVLLALNLRSVFAGLPPLLDDVRSDLGLSATAAGLLTTGPVLCFGALAPLAPWLARRLALERILAVGALLTALGAGLRGFGGGPALFAGTMLAGAAVAVTQTALPILIRERYPGTTGALTGAVSVAIGLSAAVASALVVPLYDAFESDWAPALAVWALPALAAAVPWLVLGRRVASPAPERPPRVQGRAAWWLPALFGVQSAVFFATLTWLPTILHASGISHHRAGLLLAFSSVMQSGPAFFVPVLAARRPSQRGLLLAVTTSSALGFAGLLTAPGPAGVWVALVGLGQGGILGLALVLPLLRAADERLAAGLTALTLSGGYLISATGPWILGAVHDLSGGWTAPLVVLLAITLAQLPTGLPAVRDRRLGAPAG
jgi:CP family cyanate transporter-like MFS transporter